MDYSEFHLTQAFINLDRLTHNMKLIQAQVGRRPLWPVIKGNAYGHGAEIIARHLIRIGYHKLCVAYASEAVELVENGVKASFVILSPDLPKNSDVFIQYGLEPVVCEIEMVKGLSDSARKMNKSIGIHLKVDTGMGRVGIRPDQIVEFLQECTKFPQVTIKSIMSHFPRADELDKSYSIQQIQVFKQVVENSKPYKIPLFHIANSAAIFDLPESHFSAARPGISIYGLKTSRTCLNPQANELMPVMSLKTAIIFLKEVPAGTGISYGHIYHTRDKSLIATIPVGYGDGLSISLSNKMEVLVNGIRCRQVGRISMDQSLIDVTQLREQIKIGGEVVIIGRQKDEEVTADELARKLSTISGEIVTQILRRVPRIISE